MTPEERIKLVQEKKCYPTANSIFPVWQINYEKYGGHKEYLKIVKLFWEIASQYLEENGEFNLTNFPFIKHKYSRYNIAISTQNKLRMFRTDLFINILTHNGN